MLYTLNNTYKLKDDSPVLLREAKPEDAAPMIELALSIFNSSQHTLTAADEFKITEEQETAIIKSHAENPGDIFMLAEQDGKPIGMLNFTNGRKRKSAHTGEFAMGVHPDFRNKGVGTLLLETFINWAEKNKLIRKISLSVFINNSNAIHLYKNLGFMEEGRKKREILMDDGEFVDLVLMCKFV